MIVVEYVELPIKDLSYRFLSRFRFPNLFKIGSVVAPVSSWEEGCVILPILTGGETQEELLKKYFIKKHRKMVTSAIENFTKIIPDEFINLLTEHEVQLINCEIVPKKDPNGYLKEIL